MNIKEIITTVILLLQGTVMKPTFPGIFCTIEGVDGSGKTTLIQRLSKRLHHLNIKFVCTKEPGATILGQKIREFLADRTAPITTKAEFLLFAADRAQHVHDVIKPHLKAGDIIISDRSYISSMVYQGFLKGLSFDIIEAINTWCMEYIEPDLIIYLKIDPNTALNRVQVARGLMTKFEEEFQDHMHLLADGFEQVLSQKQNVITLDALENPEKLEQQAIEAIINMKQKKDYDLTTNSFNQTQQSSVR